jgi:hypothetical protein
MKQGFLIFCAMDPFKSLEKPTGPHFRKKYMYMHKIEAVRFIRVNPLNAELNSVLISLLSIFIIEWTANFRLDVRENKVVIFWYIIYLLTAIGFPPGGSSTVHIYTQTKQRTTQNKQYIEWHKNFESVCAVPPLCVLYPGIFLASEEKAPLPISQTPWNLSMDSRLRTAAVKFQALNRHL